MAIINVSESGVLSMTAEPVFRACDGTRVFASVPGAAVPVVAKVAGAHVVAAACALWLKSLPVPAGEQVLVRERAQGGEQSEPVLVDGGYDARLLRQGAFQGTDGFGGGTGSTTGNKGTTSTTGMNPIDPRDFRTSSPPG